MSRTDSSPLPTLLVVEDEKNTRDGLRRYFDEKYDIYLANDAASALNVLETQPVDLLLTDLRLGGGQEGLDLLPRTLTLPHPPVAILMTAYGSERVAVEAMKRGAYDYITKPLDLEKLDVVLSRALRSRKVEAENEQLKVELDKKYGLENIIGNSSPMIEIFDRIKQVAPTRATVLIEGESGTGKELVAQSLHRLSTRRSAKFVPVHCAALPPQLLESELFGHEKGAFTGASERRVGRFEEANHGTIFLDEIGEIDGATQVKLLRVLGEQTLQRVGSNQIIQVDVRVIAATNKNLETLVREGKFRDDLFYRLDVVPIHMPSLRERREDLPLLIQSFLREFSKQSGKKILGLTPDAEAALLRYDWPGNVRELRSAMEYAVVICRGEKIGLRDLAPRVQGKGVIIPGSPSALSESRSALPEPAGAGGNHHTASLPPAVNAPQLSSLPTFPGSPSSPSSPSAPNQSLNLAEMEKKFIGQALRVAHGNITEAAKLLGISRRTLHRKLHLEETEGSA